MRALICGGCVIGAFARIPARRSGNLQEINWLSAGVTVDRRLGSTQTAARSSPVLLSRQ
jgi:hypothetical protein